MFCINSIFCIIYELKKPPVLKWHSISTLYSNSCLIYKVMLKYRGHFVLVVIFQVTIAPWGTNTTKIHFVLPFIFEFNHPSEVWKRKPQFSQESKTVKDSGSSSKGAGNETGWSQPPAFRTLVSFCLSTPSLQRERRETYRYITRLTQSTHVYMCYAISFMTYDVSDLERFRVWPEVMPFFFLSRLRIFDFLIFSHIKYCFKLRRTLNRRLWVRFFDWMISNNK